MSQQEHDRFAEMFIANQARIYRYLISLVPNRADADDLFQRASLTLWKHWKRYDTEREFLPWAFRIVQNEVRNFLRTSRNRPLMLSDELIAELARTHEEEDETLARRQAALTLCIEKLPAQHRDLIERCYGSDESMKQVAVSRGQTPEAIYKAVQRIRDLLFDCINQSLATEPEP